MSNVKFSLPKLSSEQKKEVLKIAVTLFLIVGITACVLALVNQLTYKQIEKNQQDTINAAMNEVLPAESYELCEPSSSDAAEVTSVYEAKGSDGGLAGFCIQTSTSGFGGAVEIITGVDDEGNVTAVRAISMSETPGVGMKTKETSFLDRFSGKSGTLEAVKGDVKDDTQIAAVSGATVSSKAVTKGVNAALATASARLAELDAKEAK